MCDAKCFTEKIIFGRNNMSLKVITRNHGEPMECPTCGEPGHFDDMKLGDFKNEAEFQDAVFLNRHTETWECHYCWLK